MKSVKLLLALSIHVMITFQFYICLTVIFLLEVVGIILVVVFKDKARDWATDVFKNIYIENYQDDEEMVGDFFQEKVTHTLGT